MDSENSQFSKAPDTNASHSDLPVWEPAEDTPQPTAEEIERSEMISAINRRYTQRMEETESIANTIFAMATPVVPLALLIILIVGEDNFKYVYENADKENSGCVQYFVTLTGIIRVIFGVLRIIFYVVIILDEGNSIFISFSLAASVDSLLVDLVEYLTNFVILLTYFRLMYVVIVLHYANIALCILSVHYSEQGSYTENAVQIAALTYSIVTALHVIFKIFFSLNSRRSMYADGKIGLDNRPVTTDFKVKPVKEEPNATTLNTTTVIGGSLLETVMSTV
jgi:hypothetical protein